MVWLQALLTLASGPVGGAPGPPVLERDSAGIQNGEEWCYVVEGQDFTLSEFDVRQFPASPLIQHKTITSAQVSGDSQSDRCAMELGQ